MLGLGGFGATIEVVRAQVLIAGAVLEHVIDGGEDGSGDGADGLFGTAPGTGALELGLDVAALLADLWHNPGAQGLRVQLKNGLAGTTDKPTSVPGVAPIAYQSSDLFHPPRVGRKPVSN